MRQFKVGDRVRVIHYEGPGRVPDNSDLPIGTIGTVTRLSGNGCIRFASAEEPPTPDGPWDERRFELVEPAEVEQATAILEKDEAADDGWWDVEGDAGALPVETVEWAESFNLEVRVQVRRKP